MFKKLLSIALFIPLFLGSFELEEETRNTIDIDDVKASIRCNVLLKLVEEESNKTEILKAQLFVELRYLQSILEFRLDRYNSLCSQEDKESWLKAIEVLKNLESHCE